VLYGGIVTMMQDIFQAKGFWWIPDEPQKRLYGELTYKPGESIILKVNGSFVDDSIFNNHDIRLIRCKSYNTLR
jgi:hypothetical protein